jgi:2-aminoethylphosphonate-pyruvate transaminase
MSTHYPRIKRSILLNPGPTTTTDTVKYAQVVPDICHREHEFATVIQTILDTLTRIAGNTTEHASILIGGSGTAAIESVLSSTITDQHHALVINNGAYGHRMCQILECYNIPYTPYHSDPCHALNTAEIKKKLSTKKYSHLLTVHHETTTGLLNDIHQLGQYAHEFNATFIVDAMSSFGAIPINMTTIDYLMTSSNKNLQGMPGIGIIIAKKESLSSIENIPAKSFYLDLYKQYKTLSTTGIFRFTPPIQTLYALKQALIELEEEGIENRYQRYIHCWETLIKGLERLELRTLVDHSHHSKLLTTIIEPKGFNFDQCHDYLYEHGFTIYPGKINTTSTFRIANIGDLTSQDIEAFLKCLKTYLIK